LWIFWIKVKTIFHSVLLSRAQKFAHHLQNLHFFLFFSISSVLNIIILHIVHKTKKNKKYLVQKFTYPWFLISCDITWMIKNRFYLFIFSCLVMVLLESSLCPFFPLRKQQKICMFIPEDNLLWSSNSKSFHPQILVHCVFLYLWYNTQRYIVHAWAY